MDNTCFFKNNDGSCGVLMKYCNNDFKRCHFYKTEEQYINDYNMAILKNRQNGNCNDCKYKAFPCECLTFKKTENQFM